MIGALIGDCIGSRYEFHNTDEIDFELFPKRSTYTDDTILTVATADSLMNKKSYSDSYTEYFKAYPNRGWGGAFQDCIRRNGSLIPYGSYGNGSAMRVSPVAWYYDDLDKVMEEAKKTAEVSHDHEEGIKGAQSIALAIYLARKKVHKQDIIKTVSSKFGYNLSKPLSEYERKKFDVTCQGTIPICMTIFNECESFEDAMVKSVYLGGDVDTNAAIVGSIAEAFYGEPPRDMQIQAFSRLSSQLRDITSEFVSKYVYKGYIAPTEDLPNEEKMVDMFRSLFS